MSEEPHIVIARYLLDEVLHQAAGSKSAPSALSGYIRYLAQKGGLRALVWRQGADGVETLNMHIDEVINDIKLIRERPGNREQEILHAVATLLVEANLSESFDDAEAEF